jgi:hypothetical protein
VKNGYSISIVTIEHFILSPIGIKGNEKRGYTTSLKQSLADLQKGEKILCMAGIPFGQPEWLSRC